MRKTWKMRAAALLLTAVCTVGASFAAYADDVPTGIGYGADSEAGAGVWFPE